MSSCGAWLGEWGLLGERVAGLGEWGLLGERVAGLGEWGLLGEQPRRTRRWNFAILAWRRWNFAILAWRRWNCWMFFIMKRCFGWDYRAPYYYLVTLKRLAGLPDLSRLDEASPWGLDPDHALMRALSRAIIDFAARSPGIAGVKPFKIMPDHIHLLIKLNDHPERLSLLKYVAILKGLLRRTFQEVTGIETLLFESEWHDLICKRSKQLGNFIHYIVENPRERLLRKSAGDRFRCVRGLRHYRLGSRTADALGDTELLNEPALLAVRISRKVVDGSDEWRKTMAFYEKWRPGMTAVGTWWSKGEQAACQRIFEAGGNVIYLRPEGIADRWHPPGEAAQRAVAEGRALHLSPYAPETAQLGPGVRRERCLALNALAREMEAAVVDPLRVGRERAPRAEDGGLGLASGGCSESSLAGREGGNLGGQ